MKRIIVLAGSVALLAWAAAAQDYPKAEGYLGYTYVHFFSQNVVPSFSLNGGSAQFAYNINRWFSGVLDAGAVTNNSFGGLSINNTQLFFMAGPRFSLRKRRFKPYVQAVFGGVYYTASVPVNGLVTEGAAFLPLPTDNEVGVRLGTSQTKFAMAIGGGIDLKVTRWLSFRPGSVDYYYTRIGDLRGPGDNSQNNIRYTAGLNFMFGGEHAAPAPPPPQTKTCPDGSTIPVSQTCPKMNLSVSLNAASTEVCAGETVQIVPTVAGAKPSMLGYQWSVNGQNTAQGEHFGFSTDGLQPGTYNIKLMVGGPQFNTASAQTSVTVKPYIAPTASVNASPAQISAGDKSTITATCAGQCGGTLRPPTFTSSDGSIQGDQFDSSSIKFDPSSTEQRKSVTITAACADDRNVGTGTTQIEVTKAATIAAIRLPDILFSRNSARVNNCGKRILLEQLRSYYERDSGGSVALVGHQSSDEKSANLSQERALNSAAVITAGSGICLSVPASQVQVSSPGTDQMGVNFDSNFCQSSVPAGAESDARRVVVWFIPSGGQMPASVTSSQAASSLSVSNLGCPK